MKSFLLKIYEADGVFYEGECESLIVPTSEGQYGIWADHSNMISAIVPGTLTYRVPGQKDHSAAVSYGMVKAEGNEVLVLVDAAEHPDQIDENRAKRMADAAREEMLQKTSLQDYRNAQALLARSLNRLRVKKDYEKHYIQ